MDEVTCTLLAEGSTDAALIPILQWVVREQSMDMLVQIEFANLRHVPNPQSSLLEQIRLAVELYPCRVLFIHRDSDAQPPQQWKASQEVPPGKMQPISKRVYNRLLTTSPTSRISTTGKRCSRGFWRHEIKKTAGFQTGSFFWWS